MKSSRALFVLALVVVAGVVIIWQGPDRSLVSEESRAVAAATPTPGLAESPPATRDPAGGQPAEADPGAAPTIAERGPIGVFREWMIRYSAAGGDERSALVAEGIAKARERRAEMAVLIVHDPRAALENAVSMVERQQLPPEIVDLLEERVNARGFYGVLGVVGAPAGYPAIRREVRLAGGKRYEAYVYGERIAQPTTENAALHGIAVGKALALHTRRVRPLEIGEIPDNSKPIVETCPVSGKSTAVPRDGGVLPPITEQTPAVEIGGEIHYLCDGGHIHAVEEKVVAEEGATGGPVKPTTSIPSTQSTGVRTLLYMRVAFPETQRDPQTEAAAYEMMRQVNDYFVENSYGNVYLLTTVTPLLVLGRTEAWYNGGGGDEYDVRTDAQALARQLGYDTSQYDLDVVVYSGGPGSFGGLGYVGGKGAWLKSIAVGVACHELGHNFGLWHANFWDTGGTSTIGSGTNAEYGNSYDTMGNAAAGDLQFNANHKAKINWLERQNFVHNVTTSGTYRIVQFDQAKLDPGRRYALRIRKDSDRDYWAELRQKSLSNNPWTRDGILVNWSSWAGSNGGAQLLDTTPGSPDGKSDAAIVIGRTFSDYESGVHITPVGKAGTTPEAMDVVVNLGFFPTNQPPAVTVTASAVAVAANIPVTLTATGTDADGDPLGYAWDFGDKTFGVTNSPIVSKSWSAPGEYRVRILLSDMKGGTASDSVIVRVGSPATFRIGGQVRRAGQPMANVHVHNGQSGTSYRGAYSDSDGSYTIAGLGAGIVTLSASREGYTFTPSGFSNPISVGPSYDVANFNAADIPQVTLTVTDADCLEGSSNPGRFTLARTGPTATALTVNFSAPTGTATRGTDYTLSPDVLAGTPYSAVTIPAGQSSMNLALTATDDTAAEGPEYATLEALPGNGYIIGGNHAATLTIQDSDSALPVVGMTVEDGDATEFGDPATMRVSRTGSTATTLTVRYALSGSATASVDYTALSTQVVIPAGASSALITITPLEDNLAEGSETVTVTISANAAYIRTTDGAQTSGTAIIIDNDIATVSVTATDPAAAESNGDTGTFVISRSGDTSRALTVNYALSGSAQQGVDYLPVPGVLTIPGGSSVGSVTITPIDDDLGEPQQTVFLQVRGGVGYAVVTPSSATINIADNADLPVVTIGVSDGTAGEPGSTGKFKFTTTGTGPGTVTIHYAVSGSATSGADYTALPGTLSMGKNTTAEITVTPLNDSAVEGYETVTVTIEPDAAYALHLDTSATLNLADDDQPIVSVSTTGDAFSEGSGTGRFWISRTGATTAALAVNYTMGGSATAGIDYASLPGVVTIPAGAAGIAVNLSPINDTVAEGTETIVLTLAAGPYGVGIDKATHYLADTETPPVQVRFSGAAATGSESVGTVNVAVTLSAPAPGGVSVDYAIGGGSALADVDYLFVPGRLVFAAGETAKTLPLAIIDDVYDEPAQSIILKLQNATGASLGTSTYTYTITDNDNPPTPTVAFAGASSSGAESLSTAGILVSLSAPQSSIVTIDYAPGVGTATEGSDFTLSAGTLVFAPGETAKVIPNTVVADDTLEPDETIVVTLSNPTGAISGTVLTHTYTINDDDATTVSIVANDANAQENGDAGSFLLTRSGGTTNGLVVNVSVTGSAGNGIDYITIPPIATFAPGEATLIVMVTPIDDANGEGAEGVNLSLTTGAGYLVGTASSATVTLSDDEPAVSILAIDPNATELNSHAAVLVVSRSGATATELAVNVSLSGSATTGSDYAPIPTPIVLAAGNATATVLVTPIDDPAAEGAETVTATLTAGAGYFIAAPAAATITIADDDINNPPVVSLESPLAVNIGIPAGVGLILEATASDDGRPTIPGALVTTWSKVSGPGSVTFESATQPKTSVTFGASGTYVLQFRANDGELQNAVTLTVVVGGFPAWSHQDIGAVGLAGSFNDTNGIYLVRGAGANISGTAPDAFHFAYQQLSGDGEIRGRIVSMSGGNSSAKAGVMFRNSAATTSRLAYMSLYGAANTTDDSSFRVRATDGGATTTVSTDGQNAPFWVRLVRAGSNFSGFVSPDGTAWTQVGTTQTVSMNAQVLVGLAVTSNNVSALCTAQFDNVSLSSWPSNIGVDVDAGNDFAVTLPSPASLAGNATDDGRPAVPGQITTMWIKLSGPGSVTFTDATQLETSAIFSEPGSYVLRLTGSDGEVMTYDDIAVTANMPLITVQATAPLALEHGPSPGSFTIVRTGSTAFSVSVGFVVSGSATSETDFVPLGSAVTMAIGESSARLDVMPIADGLSEGDETVTLSLMADPGYTLGSAAIADVVIADLPIEAWRLEHFGADANDVSRAGDTVDLDLDGLPNLLEYALATDPVRPTFERPIVGVDAGDLTLTYRRPAVAVDLVYSIDAFTGDGGWNATSFTEEILTTDGSTRLIRARIPMTGASEKIIRLRIGRN